MLHRTQDSTPWRTRSRCAKALQLRLRRRQELQRPLRIVVSSPIRDAHSYKKTKMIQVALAL